MSQPVNLNTANFLQLKTIKGFGDKKVEAIIKKRDEKGGQLTIEDLEEISEIHTSVWPALFDSGIITLEPSESEQAQGKEKQEKAGLEQVHSEQMQQIQQHYELLLSKQKDDFEQEKVKYMKQRQTDFDELKVYFETRDAETREQLRVLQEQCKQKQSILKLEKVIAEKEAPSFKFQKPSQTSKLYQHGQDVPSESHTEPLKIQTLPQQGPLPPKMSQFDGRSDWRPYYLQFSHIADRYKWSKQQRLGKLIECLRDKALKYYSLKPKEVQSDFDLLCKKMNERFGRKDLPHILRRQLQDLRQDPEESLEEFAERSQELAVDGYPDTPGPFVQTLVTDAFLKGCVDKRAALSAMDKDPDNLDDALQFVKSAMTNQKVILGSKKMEVKRVSFSDTDKETEPSIRTIHREKESDDLQVSNIERRLKKTEEDLAETKVTVNKILNILTNMQFSRSRSPQRSASPQGRQSPNRITGKCYFCGKEGHFIAYCPEKRNVSPQRKRSPSPLNSSGSRA